MAGLMQLLLDTVDAGIDDANFQKIQSLKVNEILLNQTNSVIDKEKNNQNQDLVDAISNERHANAAKVNKELGRDFLIDFDSNAFIKKVNGQIIGKIKEFGNFSSEVVADLYTKSVLELTMQIANGGIDTIERIASNSNQGVSEIVATSFNIAKNTPSFYKYENNTEILNGIKSDALVTGVLIAGYASLTKEEKDRLWEKAFDLTPEQTIQLYEAEVADNPYQDYPGKTEEEKQFTKANTTQFMVSGLVRAYIKYKGGTITKENFDGEDFKKFVRSQMSLDPNLINDIFSNEFINFDEEFGRIYESNSTPADDRNRFQKMEIIQVIKHYESAGKIQIDENGRIAFTDPELEKQFSSRITDWNKTLSLEEIHTSEDLDYHYTQCVESTSRYTKAYKIGPKEPFSGESIEYNDQYSKKNIILYKQKSFYEKIQESTSLSKDEISLALSDFIKFIKTTDEESLVFLSEEVPDDQLIDYIHELDEELISKHPDLATIIEKVGGNKVKESLGNPDKRKELLEELSSLSKFNEISSTITESEAKPALEARKEDMFVAPIPIKEFIRQEGSFNGKQIESSVNSFENSSEDTSSNNSTDSSAPKLEEINTSMVVSNTAMKATTRTGFWSNFMRHMREDKESKGFFGKIRSAFRKAREDSDKANGFAVDEDSTSTTDSSGSTEELTEQEAFNKSLQVDTSKSTPIAPQPEKSTTDTKEQKPEEPTQDNDEQIM